MFEARCHGDLIFLLPPEAATVVDSVRARFDPSFGLLPAHLSLLYPLETLSSLALSRIAAAIAREKPLKIDLKGWGFFPAPFWTIYASVENPAPLNAIRLRLLTALAGKPERRPGAPISCLM